MQKHFITLTLAIAFLVATNVQAGLVSVSDSGNWDKLFTVAITVGDGTVSFDYDGRQGTAERVSANSKYENFPLDQEQPYVLHALSMPLGVGETMKGFSLTWTGTPFASNHKYNFLSHANVNDELLLGADRLATAVEAEEGSQYNGRVFAFEGENTFSEFVLSFFDVHVSGGNGTITFAVYGDKTSSEVPEPATLAMLGLGLVGLGIARRRMKK